VLVGSNVQNPVQRADAAKMTSARARWAGVLIYHNGVKADLLRVEEDPDPLANDWGSTLSTAIVVEEGAHVMHAVLLDDAGEATMAVAHAAFLARSPPPEEADGGHARDDVSRQLRDLRSLETRAERACREGTVRDDRGGVRTATSPCDALLQLAHELRLAGDWRDASRLLARLVYLSAAGDRQGDLAHARHVYPYLEAAKCALAARDPVAAARAMQTIHRLQPGYRLPNPSPRPASEGAREFAPVAAEGVPGFKLVIDPAKIRSTDLRRAWHFVCEWTALEFVGPAGMLSYGSAAGNPGSVERGARGLVERVRGKRMLASIRLPL